MSRKSPRLAVSCSAVLAAAALVAGCSSGGGTGVSSPSASAAPSSTATPASATPSSTATPVPSTSTATVTETHSASPSSSGSATDDCGDGQLAVTGTRAGGATGHTGMVLRFRNTSSSTCSVFGYPGAAALDSSGAQFEQAERKAKGFFGGSTEKRITVAPGAYASAAIEGESMSAEHPSGRGCDRATDLLVTPPNTKKSTKIDYHGYSCSLEIHPVVAGRSGGIG